MMRTFSPTSGGGYVDIEPQRFARSDSCYVRCCCPSCVGDLFQGQDRGLGEIFSALLLVGMFVIFVSHLCDMINGWLFVRDWERHKRNLQAEEQQRKAEWEREEEEGQAEWKTFTNWVKQNPATAERLMLIVEEEQIADPEHRGVEPKDQTC
jgi:hypothetical protein